VPKPAISNVQPPNSCPSGLPCPNGGTGGIQVLIGGTTFPPASSAQVKFGSQTAFVAADSTATTLDVTAPITAAAPPVCGTGVAVGTPAIAATVDITVTDLTSSCTVTAAQAFQYIMPCVAAAGP